MVYVRDCIHSGAMHPDDWYSVYQLSEKLGISRSPVRDGLLRLEEAGVIEFVRNRGFRVIAPQPADVADIFGIRIALESSAAARAARNQNNELNSLRPLIEKMEEAAREGNEANFFSWDQELHDAILRAANCIRSREMLAKLRTHTKLLSDSTVREQRTMQHVLNEHQPIVEAILAGDSESAEKAMTNHLTSTGRLLLLQNVAKTHPELSEYPQKLEELVDQIWDTYAS